MKLKRLLIEARPGFKQSMMGYVGGRVIPGVHIDIVPNAYRDHSSAIIVGRELSNSPSPSVSGFLTHQSTNSVLASGPRRALCQIGRPSFVSSAETFIDG